MLVDELVLHVECADGTLVAVTRIDDPGDYRHTSYFLVGEYPASSRVSDDAEAERHGAVTDMVTSERVARLAAAGLVGLHGGAV
jgi:hypothetical protein